MSCAANLRHLSVPLPAACTLSLQLLAMLFSHITFHLSPCHSDVKHIIAWESVGQVSGKAKRQVPAECKAGGSVAGQQTHT